MDNERDWQGDAVQTIPPHLRPNRGPIGAHPPRTPSPAVGGADALATRARSHISSETPSRARNTSTSRLHILTRQWFTWIAGISAAILGFVVVLWLTSPVALPPGVAILISASVSDASSLMAAVQAANLRGTPDVRGAIEEIKRLDNERATIKGWAVDATASDSLLTVIAFAGGTHALTTVTSGPRMDVAQIFGLSGANAAKLSFHGVFACKPGEKLIVIAVTPDRTYSHFRSLVCP
ncbi:hypothetical protein KMZ93_07660 [Bradyrhizobium sediminis]|uniref:Uncharacterized protein n=1 Tax=Bradyrhizobium sediminis TaxID=2840469 RepID=A0A975P1U4_9BRAD|nr:hypothetical protein [Bradyrhizobium sediminis]QWG24756.1 hypothetical protein KMZ93_07660 [Bradyrhizobium sediminis]